MTNSKGECLVRIFSPTGVFFWVLCKNSSESQGHIFNKCTFTASLWSKILFVFGWFTPLPFEAHHLLVYTQAPLQKGEKDPLVALCSSDFLGYLVRNES